MSTEVAIEVRDVAKSFWIPPTGTARVLSNPFQRRRGRRLGVLDGISFDVHGGEFFGIIGRNGSGKSTLLKLLASIYRADRGTIRIAGRLAPFLELGVGFSPELPARENVLMNGVMMGLTLKEATRRVDEIIEFSGLEEFTDLKLKNYSSGMKVRLAFSIMTRVDADVLLIDEVLAVGDAEFQDKCERAFTAMHEAGRTVVLVTHSMAAVHAHCNRALMIEGGHIAGIGDPEEIGNLYLEINMRAAAKHATGAVGPFVESFADALGSPSARIVSAEVAGAREHGGSDDAAPAIDEGEPILVTCEVEVDRALVGPAFRFRVDDRRGEVMFQGGPPDLDLSDRLEPGERFKIHSRVDNHLAPGDYRFVCVIAQQNAEGQVVPAGPLRSLPFTVLGTTAPGRVRLGHEVTVER